MSEFDKLFGDEFFIIDSNNVNSVESKLYGYSLVGDEIIKNDNINEDFLLSKDGCFVYVKVTDDKISFYQDSNGSWGLYVYKYDDYFAISNSFLKLVEYLRNDHKISLNEDFSKALMGIGLCSIIYQETMINEIESLPRNFAVHIDKNTNSVEYEKLDFEIDSIKINSKEALDVIDKWFYKWITILRSIKQKTNNIQFNLSGGFDSRVIFLFALCANIDLNKVFIRSYNDDNYVHREDFNIASEIAEYFGFKLNNNVISLNYENFLEFNTTIDLVSYVKMGFHKQFDYRFFRTSEPVFNFTGAGGENIRYYDLYYNKNYDEIIDMYLNNAKNVHESLVTPLNRILNTTLSNLAKDLNISDLKSNYLFEKHYNEIRSKNHFGKFTTIEYLTNRLLLSPALDMELHKINRQTEECNDPYLLIALLFTRFCPKLLDFRFQGDRKIDEKTLECARKINEISPFEIKDLEFISGPPVKEVSSSNNLLVGGDVNEYLINIFNSPSFEKKFIQYFPTQLYTDISRYMARITYFPLERAWPAFTTLKLIDDINSYGLNADYGISEWFESFILNEDDNYIPINSENNLNQSLNFDYSIDDFHVIKFNLLNDSICDNEKIEFKDLNIFDLDGNPVDIDEESLFLNFNNDIKIPFNKIEKDLQNNVYYLPASEIGVGIHEFNIEYKLSNSEIKKIYVKDNKNVFNYNVWSGSEYLNNNEGFITGKGQSLETSDEWALNGDKSLKITKVSESSKWTDISTNAFKEGDAILAQISAYSRDAECSLFFVFNHTDGKQSFHNATKIQPNSIQNISLSDVVPKNTKSVAIRIWIRSGIGSSVFIDNLSIVKE